MISAIVFIMMAHAADEPDYAREAQFHRFYQEYNSKETSNEQWQMVTNEKAQSYKVQSGDNLWSLSQTLFADPNYWPKIWSLNNNSIENPHEIAPSQLVVFTPGTLGEAPSVAVVTDKGQTANTVAAAPAVEKKKSADPIESLPNSLPNWEFRKDKKNLLDIDFVEFRKNFATPEMYLSYYVQDRKITALGEVVATEMGMNSATEYQYITVRLRDAEAGKSFLVVKELAPLQDPDSKKLAHVVQVQGEIEVIELVNTKEKLYRALVKKQIYPIEVGAQFIAGEMPTVNYKSDALGEPFKSRIIGGQFSEERKIFALDSVIYLNSGANQGVRIGTTYGIFRNAKIRNDKTLEKERPRQIGKLKIIAASENYATAVVTDTSEEIRVGDGTDPSVLR